MKIFSIEKFMNRFIFQVFSLKFTWSLKPKTKNKFISLGVNCFVRTMLTRYGIKSKKKDGELSFPFDLNTVPFWSIEKILANDFSDFNDDLIRNEKTNHWENKKYKITYVHDDLLSKEEFLHRYNRRIENFRTIAANEENLKFISISFDKNVDSKTLNSIHNSLKKFCGNKDFKFIIINLKNEISDFSKKDLADGVVYKEILSSIPVSLYQTNWMEKDTAEQSGVKSFLKEIFETILNA